jgi:hypothetical protein
MVIPDDVAAIRIPPGRRYALMGSGSSRRLEMECQRNIEVIWLRTLKSDFKTIAG